MSDNRQKLLTGLEAVVRRAAWGGLVQAETSPVTSGGWSRVLVFSQDVGRGVPLKEYKPPELTARQKFGLRLLVGDVCPELTPELLERLTAALEAWS